MCGEDKLCLFDIAATGNINIGQNTKQTSEEVNLVNELLKPGIT